MEAPKTLRMAISLDFCSARRSQAEEAETGDGHRQAAEHAEEAAEPLFGPVLGVEECVKEEVVQRPDGIIFHPPPARGLWAPKRSVLSLMTSCSRRFPSSSRKGSIISRKPRK
jgi:hypothetical protein